MPRLPRVDSNPTGSIGAAFSALQKVDGRAVTYQRGGQSVTLTAVIDAINRDTTASGKVERYSAVFTFRKSDLKFDSTPVIPQKTDRIVWDGKIFDVVEGANGSTVDVDEAGRLILSVYGQQIGGSDE